MKSLTRMTSDDLGTQENLLEVPVVSVYTHRAIVAWLRGRGLDTPHWLGKKFYLYMSSWVTTSRLPRVVWNWLITGVRQTRCHKKCWVIKKYLECFIFNIWENCFWKCASFCWNSKTHGSTTDSVWKIYAFVEAKLFGNVLALDTKWRFHLHGHFDTFKEYIFINLEITYLGELL